MQENTQTVTKTTAAPKPQTVKRKIGKTTYELSLHFSQTSTERMSDKVMRLLENDLSVKKIRKTFLYVLDKQTEMARSILRGFRLKRAKR